MINNLPVLGISGWQNSGKTTLIEKIIPSLVEKGLKVAVVKHDAHGIDIDKPGKDSDRFYRAGADVILQGPSETASRIHKACDEVFERLLISLCRFYDIVIVEGHKGAPVPKLWLLREGDTEPPEEAKDVVTLLPWESDRAAKVIEYIDNWLPGQWLKTPLYACILIGGKSVRMGQPKHLIEKDGETWLKRTLEQVKPFTSEVVIVGEGFVPDDIKGCKRLPDIGDAKGPMAGILSAMRWAPTASWLVMACDMPDISENAVKWLLSQRKPGVWAILPRLAGEKGIEPLLAHYDFRSHELLEQLAAAGNHRLHKISDSEKIISPTPPEDIAPSWRNINYSHEL